MAISLTLQQYLSDRHIDYDTVVHEKTGSSSKTAEASHVPGSRLAKAVIIKDEDAYLMVVLPASHHLRLKELQDMLHQHVELANEKEITPLFSDCDEGAIPPLGMAYGLEVLVDESLSNGGDIYFEGGDHMTLVHMQTAEFEKLLGDSTHGHFSRHDRGDDTRNGFRFSHT